MRIGIVTDAPRPPGEDSPDEQPVLEQYQAGIRAIEGSLRELGHSSERLPLGDDVAGFLGQFRELNPELVFNLCESFRRESLPQANVAALLDRLAVPYTGSGPGAIGLATDKALGNAILASRGIPVPTHLLAFRASAGLAPGFRYPVIVKPLYEDGSYGITGASVVCSDGALAERITQLIDRFHQPCLVEEFVAGREINAAVLGNSPPAVLPLSELQYRGFPDSLPSVCGFEAKWVAGSFEYENTVPVCPAPLPAAVEAAVRRIAVASHLALGCRDYSRIDIRLDREGMPLVLEVNTNPDLSPEAGFARSFLAIGRSYTDLVASLVELALERRPH